MIPNRTTRLIAAFLFLVASVILAILMDRMPPVILAGAAALICILPDVFDNRNP